jgi:hypothetical protein
MADKVKDRIVAALQAAGLGERVGKFYSGTVSHSIGLPTNQTFVLVKPDWSPVDGNHVIAVTTTEVASYGVRIPYNYNNWCRLRGKQYKTPEEMAKAVEEMVAEPKGCW